MTPGFLTRENVTLLPHIGAATIETFGAMGYKALDDLDAVLPDSPHPTRSSFAAGIKDPSQRKRSIPLFHVMINAPTVCRPVITQVTLKAK